MPHSASISLNRITVGLPPYILRALYEETLVEGCSKAEIIRRVLREWNEIRKLRQ